MSAQDNLNPRQFYHGYMPTKALVRTEEPLSKEYQGKLEEHIRQNNGEIPGELSVRYTKASHYIADENGKVGWVQDGNHRHLAAEKLGIEWLPVKVRASGGPPPSLYTPERDEWGEV